MGRYCYLFVFFFFLIFLPAGVPIEAVSVFSSWLGAFSLVVLMVRIGVPFHPFSSRVALRMGRFLLAIAVLVC